MRARWMLLVSLLIASRSEACSCVPVELQTVHGAAGSDVARGGFPQYMEGEGLDAT